MEARADIVMIREQKPTKTSKAAMIITVIAIVVGILFLDQEWREVGAVQVAILFICSLFLYRLAKKSLTSDSKRLSPKGGSHV